MYLGRLLPCALLMLSAAASSQPAAAPFRSIELHNGGEVTVHHGASQSVRTISGSPSISVTGGRLVIDNRHSPHESRTRVAVTTPAVEAMSVDDGGKLIVGDGFPGQPAINARVANGGMLDLRRLAAGQVTANVNDGGLIYVRAEDRLDASVSQGGKVTYWGNPKVKSSVRQGGVVSHGDDGVGNSR